MADRLTFIKNRWEYHYCDDTKNVYGEGEGGGDVTGKPMFWWAHFIIG